METRQPKFKMGDRFKVLVSVETKEGLRLSSTFVGLVHSIIMSSDATDMYYTYRLSTALPGAYFGGGSDLGSWPEHKLEELETVIG